LALSKQIKELSDTSNSTFEMPKVGVFKLMYFELNFTKKRARNSLLTPTSHYNFFFIKSCRNLQKYLCESSINKL